MGKTVPANRRGGFVLPKSLHSHADTVWRSHQLNREKGSRGNCPLQGQGTDLDYHIKCNTAPKKERHCVRFVLE